MSNGAQCCALEICCPPNADGSPDPKAVEALAKFFGQENGTLSPLTATVAARRILEHFELADRGSLTALKASMVQHAKHV